MAMLSRRPPRPEQRQPFSPPARQGQADADVEEGPLWNTIKGQLYKSEVYHIKRLVGESLIQKNRTMWDEIRSLRSIFTDFQEQNDELSHGARQQVQICGTQHRDLLKRQAQIILQDLQSQAAACGHVLEDMVPEMRDDKMRKFMEEVAPQAGRSMSFSKTDTLMGTPPMTPSTRPSSASGVSVCSSPDVGGIQCLPLGRQLGVDELSSVAEGIREALEAEHEALLGAIGEQMNLFEIEEARRADVSRQGPSTSELQQFVHKLQELAVSPTLRTLSTMANNAGDIESAADDKPPAPAPISGGASVRRLKALIAERRRDAPPPLTTLGTLPEKSESPVPEYIAGLVAAATPQANGSSTPGATFDPFFDDPFA